MTVGAGGIIYAADMNRALRGGPERPLCIVRRGTMPFSVATNGVVVPWDVETIDYGGMHSTVTNTSRITPTTAGYYELSAALSWAATSATGRRATAFRVNGGTTYYGDIIPGTTVGNTGTTHNLELPFNGTTDYVEVFAYQNSGGAYDIADATSSFFSAKYVRDL